MIVCENWNQLDFHICKDVFKFAIILFVWQRHNNNTKIIWSKLCSKESTCAIWILRRAENSGVSNYSWTSNYIIVRLHTAEAKIWQITRRDDSLDKNKDDAENFFRRCDCAFIHRLIQALALFSDDDRERLHWSIVSFCSSHLLFPPIRQLRK